jgi:superfamily I DNA and/or RNA helicase
MEKILQTYLRRLVNLSSNNRSLLLLRLASDQFIDIHDFNFLEKDPSFAIIEKLIARNSEILLCKQVDSRDDQSNEVSRKLKKLKRIDDFIFEERGSRDLFVGWPFIRGKFSDGTLVRAPLLFFPVSLEIEKNKWVLLLREDLTITFNKSFLMGYSYFNQVKLDDELIERTFEDYDPDSTVFRTEIYQTFRDSPVDINFNPDNFTNNLVAFKNFIKADFEKHEQNGELKLYPEAVLGIFPQAGSQLVPDYQEMLERGGDKDLEEFFLKRSIEHDKNQLHFAFLDQVREEDTYTPFKMDAFQENALKAVKKGNSLVVQGPPGTGKSQLICNLISDFIARGKTVLVVSQKRAALDVVFDRMKSEGLADFLGLVHDFKNDRKKLYEKIALHIERIEEYESRNNSLDIVHLERTFQQASRRIDQISEELEEFKFALFDTTECGISVKELYLTSDKTQPGLNLKFEYRNFKFDDLSNFELEFQSYVELKQKFASNHPWNNRKSFAGYGLSELKRMEEILVEIQERAIEINAEMNTMITHLFSYDELISLEEKKEDLRIMRSDLSNKEIFNHFLFAVEFSDSDSELLWVSNMERIMMEFFVREGVEKSLAANKLGEFQEVLQKRLEARKNPVKYLRWLMFSKDKYYLKRVMVANELRPTSKELKKLVKKIDNRLNLEHNLTKLKEKKWIQEIPVSITKVDFQTWFEELKQGLRLKKQFTSVRLLQDYFSPIKETQEEFLQKISRLIELLEKVFVWKTSWETYLSIRQIQNIYSGELDIKTTIKTLHKDFDNLCELDNLIQKLSNDEINVIEKALEKRNELGGSYDPWPLFSNSLRLAWIDHIESKYPILRSVSSIKFGKLEKELQAKVKEKIKVSNEILLVRVREKTYQNVLFNRLKNRISYRDLHHQATKKKRIWPLRKLIDNYAEDLFNLIPCWLASPESVSAIFPMMPFFDLVVFDEASQTFTEQSIPAMYRGRQIVIAGDNMQLRPNDLYKIRWDDESEDPSVEVDSLLELASQYLMSIMLQGHYRSKSLDLIDFSNRNFYKGKLNLLPDKNVIERGEPSIKYIKVEGIWEDNRNDLEAREVARLVFDIMKRNSDKEIGIVTFNARQQMHIMDVLDEESIVRKILLPQKLFIKNIENVQGDERDIIIFSTGYGPNPNGKIILQFGSLNVEGGENRLNVAITRAREKIYVVSSLFPQQLKTGDSKNPGPKLLKEYLEYSLEVSEGKFQTRPHEPAFKPEWYLKEKLKPIVLSLNSDLKVTQELPFADLTIKKNNNYLGLILTDDDLYNDSLSIKQMHVYKPFTLSSKHWKAKGIFSREFWNSQAEVEDSIRIFVHQAKD